MDRRRLRVFVRSLATMVAVLALVPVAPARAASVDDPDHARGPLDLKRLVATKHDATAPLRLRLVTYGRWPASLLDDGRTRLRFLLNADREGRHDYVGVVVYRDGRLVMRIATRQGRYIRSVPVTHPTPDSVRATIPHGIPNPDGNIWLAAEEVYETATGFCASVCRDRIPGRGWLKVTPGS
jgi:hypothetical protein